LPEGTLGVRFEHVNFAYSADAAVLHDIDFTLPPGQVLGLLGRTGSGKTTLARILLGLYDPSDGKIWLGSDGAWRDAGQLPLATIRSRVGAVTQNIQLFGASVRDNLTLFAGSDAGPQLAPPDDQRIIDTLEEIGLGAWYRALPAGLDTQLEANGSGLSAGQAQLLAMTRIFLQDPSIVVLDEATSRLDPATERLVDRAMERLIAGRTVVIIAHRLSTVQRADKIVVLEGGRILEQGERAQLAADPGSHFATLLSTGMAEVLS
jgi:ATP-binding cassette subfamily B protein